MIVDKPSATHHNGDAGAAFGAFTKQSSRQRRSGVVGRQRSSRGASKGARGTAAVRPAKQEQFVQAEPSAPQFSFMFSSLNIDTEVADMDTEGARQAPAGQSTAAAKDDNSLQKPKTPQRVHRAKV